MTDRNRKLTPLNAEESAAWDRLFPIACNECDGDEERADCCTWLALQEKFPRLRDFDGELPAWPEGFLPEGEAKPATKGASRQ